MPSLDAVRQQAGCRRREHAELHFGLAELRVGRRENEAARERDLEPTAQTLAAHGDEDRRRELEHREHERVQRREHLGAAIRQMFLDARSEAEMGAFRIEQDAAQAGQRPCVRRTRRRNAAIIAASTRFALGRERRRRSSAPSRSTQTFRGAA